MSLLDSLTSKADAAFNVPEGKKSTLKFNKPQRKGITYGLALGPKKLVTSACLVDVLERLSAPRVLSYRRQNRVLIAEWLEQSLLVNGPALSYRHVGCSPGRAGAGCTLPPFIAHRHGAR